MRNRNLLFITAGLLFSTVSFVRGQQQFQLNSYLQNSQLFNPATVGIAPQSDIRAGFRRQWTGIPDGPATFFVSGQGLLGGNNIGDANFQPALPIRTRLQRSSQRPKTEIKRGISHGIGGYLVYDRASAITNTQFRGQYAIHLPIGKANTLSFGASIGGRQAGLDYSKLNFNDPGNGANQNEVTVGDASVGALFTSKLFFVGYSADQLFQNKLKLNSNQNLNEQKLVLHHSIMGGFGLPLNDESLIDFSAHARLLQGTDVSYTAMVRYNMLNTFSLGVFFRNTSTAGAILSVNLTPRISLLYSYDYLFGDVTSVGTNSHEAGIGYKFGRVTNQNSNRILNY